MRLLHVPVLVLIAALAAAPSARAETRAFGKPLAGLKPVPLADLLAGPKDGAVVRLEGTIRKVCPNKGCWLELVDEKANVHVTFEGYSFFVPKDSAGSRAVLEGTVKVEKPDDATVKHLQGEGAGEAAARSVSIVATGVEITPPTAK